MTPNSPSKNQTKGNPPRHTHTHTHTLFCSLGGCEYNRNSKILLHISTIFILNCLWLRLYPSPSLILLILSYHLLLCSWLCLWYADDPPTEFWVTDSPRTHVRRREGGDGGGGGWGREHVGGRATEMNWGKDSPSLHQVSYCSHRGSSSQVVVVGPFILLQDLFYKGKQEQTRQRITDYEESLNKDCIPKHTIINGFIFLKGYYFSLQLI